MKLLLPIFALLSVFGLLGCQDKQSTGASQQSTGASQQLSITTKNAEQFFVEEVISQSSSFSSYSSQNNSSSANKYSLFYLDRDNNASSVFSNPEQVSADEVIIGNDYIILKGQFGSYAPGCSLLALEVRVDEEVTPSICIYSGDVTSIPGENSLQFYDEKLYFIGADSSGALSVLSWQEGNGDEPLTVEYEIAIDERLELFLVIQGQLVIVSYDENDFLYVMDLETKQVIVGIENGKNKVFMSNIITDLYGASYLLFSSDFNMQIYDFSNKITSPIVQVSNENIPPYAFACWPESTNNRYILNEDNKTVLTTAYNDSKYYAGIACELDLNTNTITAYVTEVELQDLLVKIYNYGLSSIEDSEYFLLHDHPNMSTDISININVSDIYYGTFDGSNNHKFITVGDSYVVVAEKDGLYNKLDVSIYAPSDIAQNVYMFSNYGYKQAASFGASSFLLKGNGKIYKYDPTFSENTLLHENYFINLQEIKNIYNDGNDNLLVSGISKNGNKAVYMCKVIDVEIDSCIYKRSLSEITNNFYPVKVEGKSSSNL